MAVADRPRLNHLRAAWRAALRKLNPLAKPAQPKEAAGKADRYGNTKESEPGQLEV